MMFFLFPKFDTITLALCCWSNFLVSKFLIQLGNKVSEIESILLSHSFGSKVDSSNWFISMRNWSLLTCFSEGINALLLLSSKFNANPTISLVLSFFILGVKTWKFLFICNNKFWIFFFTKFLLLKKKFSFHRLLIWKMEKMENRNLFLFNGKRITF